MDPDWYGCYTFNYHARSALETVNWRWQNHPLPEQVANVPLPATWLPLPWGWDNALYCSNKVPTTRICWQRQTTTNENKVTYKSAKKTTTVSVQSPSLPRGHTNELNRLMRGTNHCLSAEDPWSILLLLSQTNPDHVKGSGHPPALRSISSMISWMSFLRAASLSVYSTSAGKSMVKIKRESPKTALFQSCFYKQEPNQVFYPNSTGIWYLSTYRVPGQPWNQWFTSFRSHFALQE